MTDNSTTFRSSSDAQQSSAPVPKPKNPDRPERDGTESDMDMEPIALYEELKGRPYSAEFFEIGEYWNDPDVDFADDLRAIDGYYKEKVEKNELTDGLKSYKKYIKEIQKVTGTDDTTPNSVRIAKMAEYVKFMRNMKDIEKNASRYAHN